MGMTIDQEDKYMNACVKYLQKNMKCVGYRDYIIERLSKLKQIEQIIANNDNDGMIGRLVIEVLEDGND